MSGVAHQDSPDGTAHYVPVGPRPFVLVRDRDVSGVSGTGIVAEGVLFAGDVVALRWTSQWPTSVVFHDRGMGSVEAIHGHGGATRVVFTDEPQRDQRGQALARQCADARDELDTEKAAHQRTRDRVRIVESDREELVEALLKATGRDWTDERARFWGGGPDA